MSFNTVNNILFKKDKKTNLDDLTEFNPFLTMKTFSFYEEGKMVDYINDTLNIYGFVFSNTEDQFNFFNNVIPKLPKKRITYLKRKKNKETDETIPKNEFY